MSANGCFEPTRPFVGNLEEFNVSHEWNEILLPPKREMQRICTDCCTLDRWEIKCPWIMNNHRQQLLRVSYLSQAPILVLQKGVIVIRVMAGSFLTLWEWSVRAFHHQVRFWNSCFAQCSGRCFHFLCCLGLGMIFDLDPLNATFFGAFLQGRGKV